MLKIAGIEFDIVPSNNHASPSGALPFLLPSSSQSSKPLTGEKIHKYAREHAAHTFPNISSPRLEAYQALLTQNIRPAWVSKPRPIQAAPTNIMIVIRPLPPPSQRPSSQESLPPLLDPPPRTSPPDPPYRRDRRDSEDDTSRNFLTLPSFL